MQTIARMTAPALLTWRGPDRTSLQDHLDRPSNLEVEIAEASRDNARAIAQSAMQRTSVRRFIWLGIRAVECYERHEDNV